MTSPTSAPDPWAAPGTRAPLPPPPTGWPQAPPPPQQAWSPPGGGWGPPPGYYVAPRPRRGLGRGGVALLTLTVLTMLTGVGAAVERQDEIRERQLAERRAAITRELPALQAFVEKERGLRFKEKVEVELLDDDDFVKRLNADDGDDGDDDTAPDEDLPAYDLPSTLFALDLIGDVDEFAEALGETLDSSVQGVYEFRSKALVIRGGELNPLTRLVLVHELTHALQDQHFDLSKRDFSKDADEQQLAWTALVEGDANRVDAAYRESLPASVQAEIDRLEQEQYAGTSFDGPEVIYTLLGFPYAVGPDFVLGVLAAGGQKALDEAFRTSPPTTSEHILHPDEYVQTVEPAASVDEPAPDGSLLDEGVLGELGLIIILGRGGTRPANTPAVRGWAGDYYVTYRDDDETCFRADIVMETTADRDELLEELTDWAKDTDGTVVSRSSRAVELRRCED